MDNRTTTRILDFDQTLAENIIIRFCPADDPRSDEIKSFCDELAGLANRIEVTIDENGDGDAPSILIGNGLRYQAVPIGRELNPFLEALRMLTGQVPADIIGAVSGVSFPVDLKLFIAQQCGFCPGVVRQMLPLPFANQNIRLTVIDSFLFSELSRKQAIKSVPAVILDDRFRWTGSVPRAELIDAMVHRDPSRLSAPILERMILEGNASELAGMMIKTEILFPAFLDVLLSEQFSIRLGAMAAMEEIADSAPSVGEQIIDPLNDRFNTLSDQVKGDVLYVFGELKTEKALPLIQQVINGDYDPEVKEAARDALENISK